VTESDEHDDLDDADDFVVAGLFDPAAANAASVLALLRYLVDEVGASIPELVQAQEEGGLMSFAAVRTLRPDGERGTLSDVAARAGIEPAFAAAIWRAAGFPDVRPFERRFGATDTVVFELVRDLATIVGRDQSLQLVRTAGEAVARIAEAEIALLRSNVEAPLAAEGQFEDVARTYAAAASQLVPRVTSLIDTFHRHQLEVIAHRYSAVNAPTSTANVVELAVGFADIAGYTGLSHQLDASDLATMLARFEATTGDVIAASGADVIVYPTAIGSEPDHPGFDTEPLWEQVIRANGIANGTFMVVPNRIGTEGPVSFYGSSFISDPYGRVLVQAPRDEPAVLVADLDLDQRRDWLTLFPFLATRRPDVYGGLAR